MATHSRLATNITVPRCPRKPKKIGQLPLQHNSLGNVQHLKQFKQLSLCLATEGFVDKDCIYSHFAPGLK